MALWRDGDWLKFVWNSGIQYTYSFSVHQPIEKVIEKTRVFYESRGGRRLEEAAPNRVDFRRGSRLVSALSPVLLYSDKWLDHAIRLDFFGNGEFTEVSATYDARARASIFNWPFAFAQETRELERLLVNDLRRRPRFARREFGLGVVAGVILTIAAMTALGFVLREQYGHDEYYDDAPEFSSLGDRLAEAHLEPNGEHDAYGIILNGDDSRLHRRNVSLAYKAMLNNGYLPENIFVFSYEETREDAESSEDFPAFCTYAPDFANIQMVFKEFLLNVVDESDYLTVYATGHGTQKGRISELVIRDNWMRPDSHLSSTEFAALLDGVQPRQAVFIFDQCHGGFDGVFPMANYLVVSRSRVTETGYCKEFAGRFLGLLDPKKQERTVSIGEAFATTCRFDEDYRKGHYTPTMTGPLKDMADNVYLAP